MIHKIYAIVIALPNKEDITIGNKQKRANNLKMAQYIPNDLTTEELLFSKVVSSSSVTSKYNGSPVDPFQEFTELFNDFKNNSEKTQYVVAAPAVSTAITDVTSTSENLHKNDDGVGDLSKSFKNLVLKQKQKTIIIEGLTKAESVLKTKIRSSLTTSSSNNNTTTTTLTTTGNNPLYTYEEVEKLLKLQEDLLLEKFAKKMEEELEKSSKELVECYNTELHELRSTHTEFIDFYIKSWMRKQGALDYFN